jgi:hypothetical protein
MLHEARMIETVTARHIVGVLLGEPAQRGTIGVAQAGAGGAQQQCESKADGRTLRDVDFHHTLKISA